MLDTLNLWPHVLAFQRDKSRLNRSSITPDIVNSEYRSETNSSKRDCNSWPVTVQVFVDEQF